MKQILEKDSVSYIQFVNALHSPATKECYTGFLNVFLNYVNMKCDALLELEPKKLQGILIAYVVDMKDNIKLAPNSMKDRIAALKTFFEMNDYVSINWPKVKRYIGEFRKVAEDRPYTREEIKLLLDAAPGLRNRAMILLLASSGIRRGAILDLQLKHLKKIDKYNIFMLDVYKQSGEHYVTFCSSEARKAIEEYLNWREKLGEKLTPETILFRKEFNTSNRKSGARSKPLKMTPKALRNMLTKIREQTGVIATQPLTESIRIGSHRSEIMMTHGFRKFFATTLETEGVNSLYVEYLLGHKDGLKFVYAKPTSTQLLEGNGSKVLGYISGINALTINEENRLRRQVQQLTIRTDKLEEIQNRMDRLDRMLGLE